MPHNSEARREAAAVALVLFGEHGRTVEGYRPADEDLDHAAPASSDGCRRHVRGPHLRTARATNPRNRTGVVGISIGRDRGRGHTYFWVNLGRSARRFCITTLGRDEAWRRAVALRLEHLRKLAQANAVILAARARGEEQGAGIKEQA